MSYTLGDFAKIVQHAIGGSPDAQLVTTTQLVNDVGEEIAYSWPWIWRQRKFSLAIAQGANAVAALPSDFAGIHTAHVSSAINQAAAQFRDEVLPLRPGRTQKGSKTYNYIIESVPQVSQTTRPTLAMYVFPAAPAAGFIEGVYLRSIAVLSTSGQNFDMPPRFDVLLGLGVRAHAMTVEGVDGASAAMERYQTLLQKYQEEDDSSMSNLSAKESQPAV